MSKKRRGHVRRQPAPSGSGSWRAIAVAGVAIAAIGVVALAVVLSASGPVTAGAATAWSTLGTRDVHSLAFDPTDDQHLYFGHHGGLLETTDGGRTWQRTALTGADAMNVASPADGFFQIAGHNVYKETADGGATWQDVPNDLPGLDLHSFVADPAVPSHAWAFAVGFGLFETRDGGRTWEVRQSGNWGALTSFVEAGQPTLVGVGPAGLGRSDDGGRTWAALGQPRGQVASLTASADGGVMYAGTTTGVSRSTDGGRSWTPTPLQTFGVTVAVDAQDPNVVAVVDDQTRFFRSSDGGATWPAP